MSKLGARIKTLREQRGWSQLSLAQRVCINNSVLSRIEAGKRDVEDELLNTLADVFQVSSDFLLGRTEDHSPYPPQENPFDPEVSIFFKDYLSAPKEKQEELLRFWEFMKHQERDRKPGDQQGG